jgi:hypothetical protein
MSAPPHAPSSPPALLGTCRTRRENNRCRRKPRITRRAIVGRIRPALAGATLVVIPSASGIIRLRRSTSCGGRRNSIQLRCTFGCGFSLYPNSSSGKSRQPNILGHHSVGPRKWRWLYRLSGRAALTRRGPPRPANSGLAEGHNRPETVDSRRAGWRVSSAHRRLYALRASRRPRETRAPA